MLRYRPSPAMLVALVLLFVALGGTSYALHATNPHERRAIARQSAEFLPAHASRGVPTVRAYALVTPPRPGFGSLEKHYTSLNREHSLNITLTSALPKAPQGTWCFVLGGRIDLSKATVIASTTGAGHPPFGNLPEIAQWIPYAPDCRPHQIEVQTISYTVQGTSPVANHEGDIAFSFVVLD